MNNTIQLQGLGTLSAKQASQILVGDLLSFNHHPWQPIETIPKDGTPVLVTKAGSLLPPEIAWHDNDEEIRSTIRCYTHWMPLPQPPTKMEELDARQAKAEAAGAPAK